VCSGIVAMVQPNFRSFFMPGNEGFQLDYDVLALFGQLEEGFQWWGQQLF
jgi:hypothetical protein